MLVEPACGAAIAPFYCGIIERLQKEGQLGHISTVVCVVCGGHSVTTQALQNWQRDFGLV